MLRKQNQRKQKKYQQTSPFLSSEEAHYGDKDRKYFETAYEHKC